MNFFSEKEAEFTVILKDQKVKEKKQVVFETSVSKDIPVKWLKNGKPLPENARYQVNFIYGTSFVVVVNRQDAPIVKM